MFASYVTVQDIADFKPAENITEIKLIWEEGPSIEEVLPILKRWRHLRQLTLQSGPSVPQFEMLCDFIMGMKYLTYVNFIPGLAKFAKGLHHLRRQPARCGDPGVRRRTRHDQGQQSAGQLSN